MPPITGMASYEQVARTQQDMIRQKGAHYAQKQVHYICGKLPDPMQIMILHQCGARVSSFFDPEHTTTASWHLNLVSEKAKSASPYLKKPVFAPSPMHCTWQSPRNSQCSSCLLSPQCRHGARLGQPCHWLQSIHSNQAPAMGHGRDNILCSARA